MRHTPHTAAPWRTARAGCVTRKPHRWTSCLPDKLHPGMPPRSPFFWRQACHTHNVSPMTNASHADALAAPWPFATLPIRATRRLLQSGRCFAAHDTCCFMRHGCRFHCADPWPSASKLSGFPEAIDALGRGLRRVNSPRSVSLSGSSTRSALHTFSFCCALTPRLVLLQFGLSIRCLSNEYMRQIVHTPPRLSLPGDAA